MGDYGFWALNQVFHLVWVFGAFQEHSTWARGSRASRRRPEGKRRRNLQLLATRGTMVKENPKIGKGPRRVDVWAVQCDNCFKWRTIPTQEEFEEIRSKFQQDPFLCSKKLGISCDVPGDIEYDSTRTWVLDRPNIPKTPVGFKRRLVMRRDYSKMDTYYDTPTGRTLRSSTQVASFLSENPQFKDLSPSDFCFSRPKIMADTIPDDVLNKASPFVQRDTA